MGVVAGCVDGGSARDEAGQDSAIVAAPEEAAARLEWAIDTLDLPGFRAHGWAGGTLWGIARGRLARAVPGGAVERLEPVVWGVHTSQADDHVSWTNEAGFFARGAGGDTRQLLRPEDAPRPEYTVPEVFWANDTRALLIWTDEAGPGLSLFEGGGKHRELQARQRGYLIGGNAVWIDNRTVLLHATSMVARTGPSDYRESGYRANLALLDVERDTMWLVTDVPDGTFLRPEGLLHRDTVLVGEYEGGSWPMRHVSYDVQTWTRQVRLMEPGRAAAHSGHIALLRPVSAPDAGGEPIWDAVLFDRTGGVLQIGRFQGYDVRLLWNADGSQLVVAQESEVRGVKTMLVRVIR